MPSIGRDGSAGHARRTSTRGIAGSKLWGKGSGVGGLFNAKGERIADAAPRVCNMGIWWDGDLLRELLDGVTISKWD